MRLRTPQDIEQLERDLCSLTRCERPDPLLLRCRPFVHFRSAALSHMASPGSTRLAAGQRVHFWLVGLVICVQEVYADGSLDACIDSVEIMIDI